MFRKELTDNSYSLTINYLITNSGYLNNKNFFYEF
jgi:hypothetical protein